MTLLTFNGLNREGAKDAKGFCVGLFRFSKRKAKSEWPKPFGRIGEQVVETVSVLCVLGVLSEAGG